MPSSLDVSAWNLVAGAALLAGCNSRSLDGSADETSTSMGPTDDATESGNTQTETTESETTTDTTETGEDPECRTDDDCDTYYLCNNGECVECITTADCAYQDGQVCIGGECVLDPDLPGGQICWSDDECPEFEICRNFGGFGHGYCQSAGTPPADCELGLMGIPTVLDPDAPPLALSFVDVDADGQDELVAVTETEILVYEVGVDVPTATARDMPSPTVQAIVPGQFDAQSGEDLVLLVGADQHRYFADGVAGFVSPSVDASPLLQPMGLLAGDFDGMGFSDLLVWGPDGAVLQTDGLDGLIVPIAQNFSSAAAAFDLSTAEPGLLLADDYVLRLFDFMGGAVAEVIAFENFPPSPSLVAAHAPAMRRYVSAEDKGLWTMLRLWYPEDLAPYGSLLHPSDAAELAVGDLDGDQHDEIVTVGAELTVVFLPLDCIATVDLGVDGVAIDHATGDHDGDGDDEVAVALDSGVVVLVDGE
jgi:hypothetical protein